MDNYNYESMYGENSGYTPPPRWDDFTLNDEKTARHKFSKIFFAIFVYTVVSSAVALVSSILVSTLFPATADSILNSMWYVWGMNIFCMYIVALPVLYLIIRRMRSVPRVKRRLSLKEFISFIAVGHFLMLLGSLIGNYLNLIIGAVIGQEVPDTLSDLITNSPIWVIIAIVVVIGPIVEELIFRKFLMDKLGAYGDRIAIVVSAVAFGLFHGNFYQIFYATFIGLILAYLYAKTSNIWYPIALHMIMNFIGSVLPIPLMKYFDQYSELLVDMENGIPVDTQLMTELGAIVGAYSIFQYALALAGAVVLYKKRRSIFVSDRCEVLIPKNKRVSVIIFNVGSILFAISCLGKIIMSIFAG